eukprot:c33663_g1_i1 orf=103-294(-)
MWCLLRYIYGLHAPQGLVCPVGWLDGKTFQQAMEDYLKKQQVWQSSHDGHDPLVMKNKPIIDY